LEGGRKLGPVSVTATGPRTSLAALVAAAVETKSIASLHFDGAFKSLREVITRDLTVDKTPELFCFGLLEEFDIPQIVALVRPRSVVF
jgi:hypothetical protein